MALFNFHRVLIAAYILFDLFFTILCLRRYSDGVYNANTQLMLAAASSVITVGLVFYLVHFNKRMRVHNRLILDAPASDI